MYLKYIKTLGYYTEASLYQKLNYGLPLYNLVFPNDFQIPSISATQYASSTIQSNDVPNYLLNSQSFIIYIPYFSKYKNTIQQTS